MANVGMDLAEAIFGKVKRTYQRSATRTCVYVHVTPPLPGSETKTVVLTNKEFEQYEKWLRGEGMIQDLLPNLSANHREILLNGAPL